jgi:hypothetical protein
MRILSLLQARHTFAVWKFVRLGTFVWLGGRLEAAYKHSVPGATNRAGRHPARPIACTQWRLRAPIIGQFIVLGLAWTASEVDPSLQSRDHGSCRGGAFPTSRFSPATWQPRSGTVFITCQDSLIILQLFISCCRNMCFCE